MRLDDFSRLEETSNLKRTEVDMINLKSETYQYRHIFCKKNQCSLLQGPARARICKAMMRTQIGINRYIRY